MKIDLNNIVSISEANQNFSKVARMVDKSGTAVILKNNAPKYILMKYEIVNDEKANIASAELLDDVAKRVLQKHKKALEELAK